MYKYAYDHSKAVLRLWIFLILCLSLPYCLTCVMQSCGHLQRKANFLAFRHVVSSCVIVTFSYGILGQMWHLIASIPDLFFLHYFKLPKFFLYFQTQQS